MALAAGAAVAGEVWHVPGDFGTIAAALGDPLVLDGDTIMVGPGEHEGAYVRKGVEIKGEDGAVITSGPLHGSGLVMGFRFLAESDGATISHLTFAPTVGLAIMNGAAVNDITVTHCTFQDSVQAVSNWCGHGWEITHNTISDLRADGGGGIGILLGDYTGEENVYDNLVAHNKITGTLHVAPDDGGGYGGSGIVVYADFRWGGLGAKSIAYNRILKNKVDLVSERPSIVDVWAFELTDTRDDPYCDAVIFDNTVGFNDWSNMDPGRQIALTPLELGDANAISRNLGDNRGHGLHPGLLFGPND